MSWQLLRRERLTDEHISQDLSDSALIESYDWQAHYFFIMTVCVTISLLFALITWGVCSFQGWFGRLFFRVLAVVGAVFLYCLVRYIIEARREKQNCAQASSEEFVIKREKLLYAAEEARLPEESRPYGARVGVLSEYADYGYNLHFPSGVWNINGPCYMHSEKFRMSVFGVYRMALKDDEFYVIFSKETGRLLYAYPMKYFRYVGKKEMF